MEILEAAGLLQLCARQDTGCEAAVHAVCHVLGEVNTEAALLVDASNAFNSLNRQVALYNLQNMCPSLATILLNTYSNNAYLFIDGHRTSSSEGTTHSPWRCMLSVCCH